MPNQSGGADQVLSLPKGGGALKGLGEKFQPDLYTGTGNFSIPITVPPGRNGFQPQLALTYSTGQGNGPFGLGWTLGIPGVTLKTSKGIPRYQGDDTYILSGAEDLIPVKDIGGIAPNRGLIASIARAPKVCLLGSFTIKTLAIITGRCGPKTGWLVSMEPLALWDMTLLWSQILRTEPRSLPGNLRTPKIPMATVSSTNMRATRVRMDRTTGTSYTYSAFATLTIPPRAKLNTWYQ